jgi:hypothetical protein
MVIGSGGISDRLSIKHFWPKVSIFSQFLILLKKSLHLLYNTLDYYRYRIYRDNSAISRWTGLDICGTMPCRGRIMKDPGFFHSGRLSAGFASFCACISPKTNLFAATEIRKAGYIRVLLTIDGHENQLENYLRSIL